MVEPSTLNECISLWNYCYMSVRHLDRTFGCRLVELGMFGVCESSLNSMSDKSGWSENDSSFYYVFLRDRKITASSDRKCKNVREVGSVYTTGDHKVSFQQKLSFSNFDDEDEVVLQTCSLAKKANMAASNTYSSSCFYFYFLSFRRMGFDSHFLPLQ